MTLFWQLLKFGIIGSTAALVNLIVVWLLVEFAHWHPLWANMVAFLIAYQVSFLGHHHWTFGVEKQHRQVYSTLRKFFLVAVFSFLLNQGLYALFLLVFHWQYLMALFLVLVLVPPVTFGLSKAWAFK